MEVSGAEWGSVVLGGVSGAEWGSMGVSGAEGSVGMSGGQWGSVWVRAVFSCTCMKMGFDLQTFDEFYVLHIFPKTV